jgi:DNA-binding response OmpR family regulator
VRVAIVEDTPDLANLARMQLELAGHQVEVLGDGVHAVTWGGWAMADVAVVDLMMPGVSGQELIPWLRAEAPHVRIVVLTADVVGAERVRVAADAVVLKPWRSEELLEAIYG